VGDGALGFWTALRKIHSETRQQRCWVHIRTTNPIASTFATVRLRTAKARGCLSRETASTMVFKLTLCAQRKWRRLNGSNWLATVFEGVKFEDGIKVEKIAA